MAWVPSAPGFEISSVSMVLNEVEGDGLGSQK